MRQDKFNNPVFSSQDLFNLIYQGKANTLPGLMVDSDTESKQLEAEGGFQFTEPYPEDLEISISEYDAICQANWNMPDEYKQMDIEGFLVNECPKENYQRLIDELQEFKARNMLDLLRWLKYFVDTCRANDILWGVGRGSSVSSYILYIIGVHKIDSIKYNLDWQDFLR